MGGSVDAVVAGGPALVHAVMLAMVNYLLRSTQFCWALNINVITLVIQCIALVILLCI